ncbi:porin [Luteimonas sp. FCS-9]|uniref:OprO/OprP family phosphate-selective porin n=1 Tax=Luteimonas sp. FCS-9 TaxID=1547516 RepID=UPI00063ECC13|nr:porin [Luteimonas sp. FCS-9]KLJ02783.1 porin [Luteimonas sp. FCS-9]
MIRPRPTVLAAAVGLLLATSAASAQSNPAALEDLVRQQAEQIRQLEARLSALEAAPASGVAAVPPAATAPTAGPDAALAERVAKIEAAQAKAPAVSWSKGAPQFASADGQVTFRPRGRVFVDTSSTHGSDFDARNITGTEIRSVRLGFEGSYGILGYAVEGDFADNGVAWKSAYVTIRHTLFGREAELTVGNRLNDRGIDGSSGTGNTPFPDRNVVGTQILPQRGLFGVGLTERVYGEDWHASVSIAGNDLNNVGDSDDSMTLAGRVHWNPVKGEGGLLHLGAWGFYEDIAPGSSGVFRSSAIAGHLNDLVKIAPGALAGADHGSGYGLELLGVRGPFWGYGEWGRREVAGFGGAGRFDVAHEAWALSAGWFLSGASPSFAARTGTWGRVKVARPVTAGGPGAWELKARYENVDYGELPTGGTGDALTVGVNWYLNDFSRVMLDAIRWETDNRSGDYQGEDRGTTLNARFQLAF